MECSTISGEIMRVICLIAWFMAASGCSSYKVHCDSHLRPINVTQSQAGTAESRTGNAGSVARTFQRKP